MKPGPNRKPGAKRQRRNVYPADIVLPAEGREGPAPPLPEGPVWTMEIVRWWDDIWHSPMATLWDVKTDYLPLVRLAQLNQAALFGSTRDATEARQLEDRFYLNPESRIKRGIRVADEDDASDDASPGPNEASSGAAAASDASPVDPRRLRVVAGGK